MMHADGRELFEDLRVNQVYLSGRVEEIGRTGWDPDEGMLFAFEMSFKQPRNWQERCRATVVLTGKAAEAAQGHARVGSLVLVEGELLTDFDEDGRTVLRILSYKTQVLTFPGRKA